MKELKTIVSDEEFDELEQIAEVQALPVEEIVRRGVAEYLVKSGAGPAFEPIGFGCGRTATRCRTPLHGCTSCGAVGHLPTLSQIYP
jgi:hypothetical protein